MTNQLPKDLQILQYEIKQTFPLGSGDKPSKEVLALWSVVLGTYTQSHKALSTAVGLVNTRSKGLKALGYMRRLDAAVDAYNHAAATVRALASVLSEHCTDARVRATWAAAAAISDFELEAFAAPDGTDSFYQPSADDHLAAIRCQHNWIAGGIR